MVKDIGAPRVCRDRGSHRGALPWLVPDAAHKEQTSQVGEGTDSGVMLPGFLFQLTILWLYTLGQVTQPL